MSSVVNTNLRAAQDRKERTNDLHSRLRDKSGGWSSTPSGLEAGTVQIISSPGGERIKVSDKVMLSGATLNEALDNSETPIDVSDGTKFIVGDTIRIDNEHMYVQSISSNTLTVRRNRDGTSAVTHDNGTPIKIFRPKIPTRYSELGSETLKFVKDGSTFNYPKQMQFIPASALNFGSPFTFSGANLADYDDEQYDVLFMLKDMQTYSVSGSDESSNQSIQVTAESKSSTGFTPTASVIIASASTSYIVTSSTSPDIDRENAGYNTYLSAPTYATDYTGYDAYDVMANSDTGGAGVTDISVTYTLDFSGVKGTGEFIVKGYIRTGTQDSDPATRFDNTDYNQLDFDILRDAADGDGSITLTDTFTPSGTLGDPAMVVMTITNYDQFGGSTATLAGEITSITYTSSSGTVRPVTGINKADAIVIAKVYNQ